MPFSFYLDCQMCQLSKVSFRMVSTFKATACFYVTLFRAYYFDGSYYGACSNSNCLNLSDTSMSYLKNETLLDARN